MTISVVIPTYKREKELARLVRSLAPEKKNILEIIIMRQIKNPSMTHARNAGAKKAKGDLLLFLDDDVVVHTGIVDAYKKAFIRQNVAAVCGRVITPGQKIEPFARRVGNVTWLGQVSGGYSSTIPQEIDSVIGCNMCWRRDVYLSLGGVDEKFTGNALREETDLSLRAKATGYKILFEPKALVDHVRAETGGARKSEGRLKWYFDFFSNETYYFLKHRNKILLPLYLLTRIEWFVRGMRWSLTVPFAGIADGQRKYA